MRETVSGECMQKQWMTVSHRMHECNIKIVYRTVYCIQHIRYKLLHSLVVNDYIIYEKKQYGKKFDILKFFIGTKKCSNL